MTRSRRRGALSTSQGIPAEQVVSGERTYEIAQLDACGYYELFEHPITGPHRYPGWPFRITPEPGRAHRTTLGRHNDEVPGGLGLRAERVIGERVLNV